MSHTNRHDPYGAVHKGLRAAHMRCLVAIGAADPGSDADIERLAAAIADHLTMCRTHLDDENVFIHAALEERRPGASVHAAEDHDDHEQSFAELDALLARLVSTAPEQRPAACAALYRRFCRFVADDIQHMDHEESILLPDLQAAFSDDELREIEGRIVAAIPPDVMVMFLAAMLDALPRPDGAAMLGAMQAGMPPAAYAGLMQAVTARRAGDRPLAAAA